MSWKIIIVIIIYLWLPFKKLYTYLLFLTNKQKTFNLRYILACFHEWKFFFAKKLTKKFQPSKWWMSHTCVFLLFSTCQQFFNCSTFLEIVFTYKYITIFRKLLNFCGNFGHILLILLRKHFFRIICSNNKKTEYLAFFTNLNHSIIKWALAIYYDNKKAGEGLP